MSLFIQLIFIIAILKYCLKAASFGYFKAIPMYAAFATLFSLAMYPVIINIPGNIIESLLANRAVVTDAAVITTIEAIIGIFASILLIDNYFTPRINRKPWFIVFKVIPGIIVFAALAYFQMLFFRFNVAVSFAISAGIYAAIVFFGISLIAVFLYRNITHESVRLELKILLNLAILVVGLLVNSSIADYNISNASSSIEWAALFTISCIAILTFVAGIILYQIKPMRKFFRNQN